MERKLTRYLDRIFMSVISDIIMDYMKEPFAKLLCYQPSKIRYIGKFGIILAGVKIPAFCWGYPNTMKMCIIGLINGYVDIKCGLFYGVCHVKYNKKTNIFSFKIYESDENDYIASVEMKIIDSQLKEIINAFKELSCALETLKNV